MQILAKTYKKNNNTLLTLVKIYDLDFMIGIKPEGSSLRG